MSKYDLRTKKNYDFFECSSAMQKCIRRGLEQDAMYWAVELYESGYGEYVWKRLRIMSSEDVGLAEPMMPATIWALYRSYQEQAKKKEDKNEPQRLFLTHAVLLAVSGEEVAHDRLDAALGVADTSVPPAGYT